MADSYSLLVIAEGFTQEDDFVQHCLEMRESLLSRTPYNLLRVYPGPFSVYYAFTPSNVPGPALGTVPGDTCLRSTYDLTTGQLRIDNSALAAALLKITGAPSSLYGNWTAVRGLDLLVLLPDSAGGQAISATLEQVGSPMVTTAFVATTVDGDLWYQVPMRMISLGLGLEDEAEDPAPAPASPTGDQAQTLAYRPNVILKSAAPIGPPTAQFKWYDDLSPAQRTRALNVVPFGGTSSSTDPIQLFEGAAGFRSDVYRSATDCLMRRRPAGTGVYSLKGHEVALCVICERHLNRIVRGTWALRGKRTLRTQQLKFDEVQTWATSDGATGSAISAQAPAPTTPTPKPLDPNGPWWSFSSQIAAGLPGATGCCGGLLIENLKLHGVPASVTGDVAERIEFRDVTVTFDDGTPPQPFDFNEAFASTDHPPAFDWGNDGAVDSSDQGYLWGIKLTLYNTFGGRALVQLQMSLVLRYGVADMEPFRQIKGAKLYPQIGVQWTPGNGRVRAFRGCVRIVLKNALSTGMGMGTVASLFADSNKVGFYRRFRIFPDVPLPFEFPSWAVFFDYHRPNLQSEVEVVGVYGPNDPAPMLDIRKKDYTWPPATNYQLTVQKYPRQGEYDNFHSHGNMGPDLLDPANPPGPMIHAPGCAEACFHLHWRWGWFAKLFFIGSDIFLGWTDEGLASQPHTARGTPLVPPNQRLQVAVTRPDTVRQDPSSDVVTASRQLDPNQQAIWYTADVIDPRPGDLQVILEQGVAYAYDYDTNSPFLYASLEGTRKLLGKPDTIPFDEEVHDWYQLMRWYQGPGANVEQVPDGTLAQPGLPTPEKL